MQEQPFFFVKRKYDKNCFSICIARNADWIMAISRQIFATKIKLAAIEADKYKFFTKFNNMKKIKSLLMMIKVYWQP